MAIRVEGSNAAWGNNLLKELGKTPTGKKVLEAANGKDIVLVASKDNGDTVKGRYQGDGRTIEVEEWNKPGYEGIGDELGTLVHEIGHLLTPGSNSKTEEVRMKQLGNQVHSEYDPNFVKPTEGEIWNKVNSSGSYQNLGFTNNIDNELASLGLNFNYQAGKNATPNKSPLSGNTAVANNPTNAPTGNSGAMAFTPPTFGNAGSSKMPQFNPVSFAKMPSMPSMPPMASFLPFPMMPAPAIKPPQLGMPPFGLPPVFGFMPIPPMMPGMFMPFA